MLTIGSVDRDAAAKTFPFLAIKFSGRRNAIRDITHEHPEFVFWISPEGRVCDARDSHRKNPPKGFAHIIDDEPNYGGFLRGRVARWVGNQLIVVYCQPDELADAGAKVEQFVRGVSQFPIPLDDRALVISDNGDMFGTISDIQSRSAEG